MNQAKQVLAIVRHPVGGVRTHIVYTCPTLLQAGYQFTFVIPEGEGCQPFVTDVADWDNVQIVRVPYHPRKHLHPIFRPTVRRLLKQRSFDLIHSHGVLACLPAMFANVGIGIPHIMTSQDVFHRVGFSGPLDRLKLFALGQLLRRLDVLIAVSEDTRQDHLHYLPALKRGRCRVEMIHNGIPVDRFSELTQDPPARLRQQAGIGDEACLIGFLGRFMLQKGFLVLADAIGHLLDRADVKPFHLVAVGSGDCLINYQRELAKRPETAARITFLEHTQNVAPILRELDLLVMPSLWEAHPLLPMEAMLAGVPILGTSCLGLREVLDGSPSRMVPPGDASRLADALQQAIAAPWTAAAQAYIPTARQRFDVRDTADALQRVYDKLTAKEPGTGSPWPLVPWTMRRWTTEATGTSKTSSTRTSN